MNEAGEILPPRQCGEIVARGTLVTGGYHNLPEATAEIRAYGWHHTGDVGYIDEDGYVYIVDRKKDMIISGGFNVYCAEVESAIMALPEVQECAVIGVPDENLRGNEKVTVSFIDGKIVAVELPNVVELKVVDAPPVVKGATATNQSKEATMETGLRVRVPPFIDIGEELRIDTRTGEYLERAKG